MSAVDTPDYQRGHVSPQQLLASPNGTATVTVTLPPNVETLMIIAPGGSLSTGITVTGLTTSVEYPGLPATAIASVTASPTWFFNMTALLDTSVSVTFASAPSGHWYVIADARSRPFPIAGGSGPVSSTNVTMHHFAIAYNTPNLLTGAFLYQPALGDVMIEAWVEIDTAWNGTTPRLDVGTFSYGTTQGWWATQGNAVPLHADRADGNQLDNIFNTQTYSSPTITPSARLSDITNQSMVTLNARQRILPASVFDATQSIKVCVSQDGTVTGANPGSTQGSGIIYMLWGTVA